MNTFIRFLTVITVIGTVCFTACQKSDLKPNMVADVDSTAFSAISSALAVSIDHSTTPARLTIKGTSSNVTPGTTVYPCITLTTQVSVGVHPIPDSAQGNYFSATTLSTGSPAVSGQVQIVSNASGTIKGNFSFIALNGVSVNGGQFACAAN